MLCSEELMFRAATRVMIKTSYPREGDEGRVCSQSGEESFVDADGTSSTAVAMSYNVAVMDR